MVRVHCTHAPRGCIHEAYSYTKPTSQPQPPPPSIQAIEEWRGPFCAMGALLSAAVAGRASAAREAGRAQGNVCRDLASASTGLHTQVQGAPQRPTREAAAWWARHRSNEGFLLRKSMPRQRVANSPSRNSGICPEPDSTAHTRCLPENQCTTELQSDSRARAPRPEQNVKPSLSRRTRDGSRVKVLGKALVACQGGRGAGGARGR